MNTSHDTSSCCNPSHVAETSQDESAIANCCSPDANTDTSTVLDELQGEETPADVAAIRNTAFNLLLEHGEPVSAADLTAATGISPDRVAEIYGAAMARGRVEFDNDGNLIGIAGLSLTPSRHQLTIGNTTRWTWCALDAVGILGALNATGTIRSTDPHTGDTIEIKFAGGVPDTNTHLFILGGYTDASVREDWCPQVNFFNAIEDAQAWVTANDVEGDIVAVTDITADAAEMWRPVVEIERERPADQTAYGST